MGGRVRMALMGCGAISAMHVYGLQRSGAAIDVVATIDVDRARAEAAAAQVGAAAFGSLGEALEGAELDAVDVMLPHHLHEPVACEAFAAGLHVLLEKPMAPTVEGCDRILAAASEAGTVFLVAENAQYWPEVVAVRDLLERGAIGEVTTARGSALIPPLPDFYGGDEPWRFDNAVAGGGIAIDTGSHWIRPLRMWLGEVEEVVGVCERPFAPMEGESLVRALLRFEPGTVASLDLLLTAGPLAPESLFRVTGTEGELTVEADGTVRLYERGHRRGVTVGEPAGYLESYAGAFDDFAAAVLHGRPPAAGPEVALGELRTALAIYRSVETARWEPVWS